MVCFCFHRESRDGEKKVRPAMLATYRVIACDLVDIPDTFDVRSPVAALRLTFEFL